MKILNQETRLVPIDSIQPDERSPNQGDIGAITESVAAHGFFGSVLVQERTNRIIAGAHRYAAAKALGAREVPVTFVDVDDERARRIMLADNRTARLGADNPERLAQLLQELAGTTDGLAGTGYDGDALDELLADLGHG